MSRALCTGPHADLETAVVVPHRFAAAWPANPHRSISSRRRPHVRTQQSLAAERARGGAPSVNTQRQAVQQQIAGKGIIRRSGRSRGGTGDVEQAATRARKPASEQRCGPRVEIRVARQTHVEAFELLGGPSRSRALRRRGSARTRSRPGADRRGLARIRRAVPTSRGRQQPSSRIERSRPQAGLGRRQCSSARRVGIALSARPHAAETRPRPQARRALWPGPLTARARRRRARPVPASRRPGARHDDRGRGSDR